MVVSLKSNIVLQKADFSNKKRNIRNMNKQSISCKIKEFPMQNKNLYQVLSLESPNVTFEDLKKAYRAKALQLHPDVCPSSIREECTKQFVELHKAYEVLSDPNSRRMYDNELFLVESFRSCGSGHNYYDDHKGNGSRKVWELQLAGLKKRSADRVIVRMNSEFM